MKKITLLLLLSVACSVSMNAQSLRENKLKPETEKKQNEFRVTDNPIFDAGTLLKKSANYQYISYGLYAGGAGLIIYGSYRERAKGEMPDPYYMFGIASSAVGLVLNIMAIDYKYKAGKYLEVGAGVISYKF